VRRYRQRISGPLLDRVDLRVSLQPAPVELLVDSSHRPDASPLHRTGAELARGVLEARRQAARRGAQQGTTNARLSADQLDACAPLGHAARMLLQRAATESELSARAIQSVRRVARTIADLAGQGEVGAPALATALALRRGLV
jgi:magnesium chelatase family protein